jgi:hypothetical protein
VIIVRDYQIVQKDGCYCVKTSKLQRCARCNTRLRVRGSKRRYVIMDTGIRKCFRLRQLYCEKCHRTHIEYPDIIVPYKHYSAKTIEDALQEEHLECTAENSTIYRWRVEALSDESDG